MCVCVCICGLNDLRNSCGCAVVLSHTHKRTPFPADNFSLNAATATAGALDLWCGCFYSSDISLLYFLFLCFPSSLFFPHPDSCEQISSLAVQREWLKQMKYERHKGWIKFLSLKLERLFEGKAVKHVFLLQKDSFNFWKHDHHAGHQLLALARPRLFWICFSQPCHEETSCPIGPWAACLPESERRCGVVLHVHSDQQTDLKPVAGIWTGP